MVAEHTSLAYKPRFIGLRFPASDILSQARTLYLSNRLRVLADVEAPADTLVPPALPDGTLLDQIQCFLRGLSPVHLSYLRNMGVRATLTLSIVCDDMLWGLIACHHHEPKVPPHQVREGLRQICELVAEVSIMRIESLSKIESVRTRLSLDRLLNRVRQALTVARDIPSELDACLPRLACCWRNATRTTSISASSPGRKWCSRCAGAASRTSMPSPCRTAWFDWSRAGPLPNGSRRCAGIRRPGLRPRWRR